MSVRKQLAAEDYTVAWICALPKEEAAAVCMLDEKHGPVPQDELDENEYVLGEINGHNIVIACLPSGKMGTVSAAKVRTLVKLTFRAIRFGLMVGIGGGCPTTSNNMRLGDVVVGIPDDEYPGVIQYDLGKVGQGGRFQRIGALDNPPDQLLNKVSKLRAKHQYEDSGLPGHIEQLGTKYPRMLQYCRYPGEEWDKLFQAEYDHPAGSPKNCPSCDTSKLIIRESRPLLNNGQQDIAIHYGLVASGNEVMKHGRTRESIREEYGVLCFEMEAAGLSGFPSLVIRGICDYSDSHKSDHWQEYAAITAAAYAKEFLKSFEPRVVKQLPKDVLAEADNDQGTAAKPPQSTQPSSGNSQTLTRGGIAIQGNVSSGRDTNIRQG
jgi:nucleoside phosphorylase